MTWTQTDLDNINAAIATGERRVRLADKEVEYRTIDEMMRIRAEIIKALAGNTTGMTRVQMYPTKGLL